MYKARKKSKIMPYQIFGIALLCLSLVILFYNATLSWLFDKSTTSSGEPGVLIIGTIDLDVQTDFNFKNLALSPDTIYTIEGEKDYGTYIKTSEKNNIKGVYVRVKFTCSKTNEVGLYFDENKFTSDSAYSKNLNGKWVYDGSTDESGVKNGYYYYLGQVIDTFTQFNAGYKVNNNLHNAIAGDDVEMIFQVEAVQAQFGAVNDEDIWAGAPQIFYDFVQEDMKTQ